MVLSRIWSMFIIIAIAVASFKYLFSDNYKAIYNDMVVGKGGDTVAIATKPLADVPLEISEKLKQEKLVIKDKIHYQNQDTDKVRIYRVQEASGVIGTAQTAVEIRAYRDYDFVYGLYEHCREGRRNQSFEPNNPAVFL